MNKNLSINILGNPFILNSSNASHKRVIKRKGKENRFRLYGFASILVSIFFLAFLLYTILGAGLGGFFQTNLALNTDLNSKISLEDDQYLREFKGKIAFRGIINDELKKLFPSAKRRAEVIQLYGVPSRNAYIFSEREFEEFYEGNKDKQMKQLRSELSNFELRFPASSQIDIYFKGHFSEANPEKNNSKYISDFQASVVAKLSELSLLDKSFNTHFFSSGDSREPEIAGIWGAIKGSLYVIFVCMLVALPLGVATAIFLEEYMASSKFKTIVEITVNNLAAIPSIVYGLLGLAIYLNFFGMERSSALAGGLTLALLVLPVIIVTSRNAMSAVPPSIKDAAIGLGASKTQVVFHHVLPLSMPGIMTGSILSMARALGETAPLLMIGMVAFVRDVPQKITDPSTALPVQIYIWSDLPEKGFAEKTSAAIIVLLMFLILANLIAVYLRKKFEYKW